MGPPFQTITVRRTKYLVERVKESDTDPLHICFLLHSSRRTYWVVPSRERRDRFHAISPITYCGAYRPPPFPGVWFAVSEDGKLVLAPADA